MALSLPRNAFLPPPPPPPLPLVSALTSPPHPPPRPPVLRPPGHRHFTNKQTRQPLRLPGFIVRLLRSPTTQAESRQPGRCGAAHSRHRHRRPKRAGQGRSPCGFKAPEGPQAKGHPCGHRGPSRALGRRPRARRLCWGPGSCAEGGGFGVKTWTLLPSLWGRATPGSQLPRSF